MEMVVIENNDIKSYKPLIKLSLDPVFLNISILPDQIVF